MTISAASDAAPSIARNSFARLVADGGHLALAFVSGVITARWLEPDGKGAYAALVSLVTIISTVATLGLGNAAVVLLGRKETELAHFVRATVLPVLLSSCLGAAIVFALGRQQLATQGPTLGRAITVAVLAVPIAAVGKLMNDLVNASERIVATSIVRVASHGVTVVGLLVLVVAARLHLTGAMLAVLVSSLVVFTGGLVLGRRLGASLRPLWDGRLLRRALRLGLVIEFSQSLLMLAARVDVLFVYSLASRSAAGRYSVALTLGQLVGTAASAVAFALFPRVARVTDQEGYTLVAKASRVGLAMSVVSGLVLCVAIPFALPLAFGAAYKPSIAPALILLVGGVLWGEQRILTQARMARGHVRLQVAAHGATLVVMSVLDFLLIPEWGINGAAVASVAGSAAGLLICIISYWRDASRRGTSLRMFLPAVEDFRFLFQSLTRLRRAVTP